MRRQTPLNVAWQIAICVQRLELLEQVVIATSEHSNPHTMLEFLCEYCILLKMKPEVLNKFPYLRVAGQGILDNNVFNPVQRSLKLTGALVEVITGKNDDINDSNSICR